MLKKIIVVVVVVVVEYSFIYIYIIDGDPEITTPWLLPNMPIKTHTKLTCQNDYHEIHTLTAGKRLRPTEG